MARRSAPSRIVEEDRFAVRCVPATRPVRWLQEQFAQRPVFFQGFLSLSPVRNDAFLAALAADAENAVLLIHIGKIEAGKFADAQASGVKEFQERPVAAKEEAFFDWHGRTLPASRGLSRRAQLIEEPVHLFGRDDRWDALGQLRRGNETRGVFLQAAFAHTVLEERAQGC